MRHRPSAGGTIDHGVVGLLSMVFAVLVGIGGGVLSLLLRWPGLEQTIPFIRSAAQAHVPLLVFFASIPASLGGLAVAILPGQVGSSRSAFPVLDVAALVLTITAFGALVAGACGLASIGISANMLALAIVLGAANLIATGLVERTVPFARLPSFAWTVLIAATLALCAAPIMAAVCSIAFWHGVAPEAALAVLIWPALFVVLTLVVGLVTDILADGSDLSRVSPSAIPALLSGGMLAVFMVWAYCLENRIAFEGPRGTAEAFLLLLLAPITVFWVKMVIRTPQSKLVGRLPVLFALGFAFMLPVGLVEGVIGRTGHEAISLAVVFGLLAGFFRMTENEVRRPPVAIWSAQAQFWLLLGGSLSLLLPMPPVLKAFGSAMSSLSIGLFVIHLVAAVVRSRSSAPTVVDHPATGWRCSS